MRPSRGILPRRPCLFDAARRPLNGSIIRHKTSTVRECTHCTHKKVLVACGRRHRGRLLGPPESLILVECGAAVYQRNSARIRA